MKQWRKDKIRRLLAILERDRAASDDLVQFRPMSPPGGIEEICWLAPGGIAC
jgi:hypothetical protein